MAPVVQKRANIPYKYAVGIALKNNEKLLSKEICNFIMVHMPKICTLESDNWKNAVRNALVKFSDMFVKIQKDQDKGKPLCFYTFAEGGLEDFNKEFSAEFGFPFDFLANPDAHHDLYNGKAGFPKTVDIEAAKIHFNEEQKRWASLPMELKESKKRRARKNNNASIQQVSAENTVPTNEMGPQIQMPQGNEDKENYFWVTEANGIQRQYKRLPNIYENAQYAESAPVYSPYENQLPYYDNGFGHYQQNAPGPLRNEFSYNSGPRMNPYHRSNEFLHQEPMTWEQAYLPPVASHLQQVQVPEIPPMEPLDLQFAAPSLSQGLIQEDDFQKYLEIFDAPIPQMDGAEKDLFDKYFPSPSPSSPPQVAEPVAEPLPELPTIDDSDPNYWFVM